MKIVNRFTNELIFQCAAETMRETVLQAIENAANLYRANLSDADLSGATLSGATLSGATLSGATLSGATLSGADLYRANLSGANLSDADLYRANLYRADLSDANLYRANLSGANLYRANLSGANLSGANLSGATLSVIKNILKFDVRAAICAQVCAFPEKLEMDSWHTCETVHCIAGWTTTLHPQGKLLESIYGTSAAAALILYVCEGQVPDFHSDNETAMRWIRGEK